MIGPPTSWSRQEDVGLLGELSNIPLPPFNIEWANRPKEYVAVKWLWSYCSMPTLQLRLLDSYTGYNV